MLHRASLLADTVSPCFSLGTYVAEMERYICAAFTIAGNLTYQRPRCQSSGSSERGSTRELRYSSVSVLDVLVELWEVAPDADSSYPKMLQTDDPTV